jgi:hypothetical protein
MTDDKNDVNSYGKETSVIITNNVLSINLFLLLLMCISISC